MDDVKKANDLSSELSVEILIRGALTLEPGESDKVFQLLKKGLEKLVAQKKLNNRVAHEFKRLKKSIIQEKSFEQSGQEEKMKEHTEKECELGTDYCARTILLSYGEKAVPAAKTKLGQFNAADHWADWLLNQEWVNAKSESPVDDEFSLCEIACCEKWRFSPCNCWHANLLKEGGIVNNKLIYA